MLRKISKLLSSSTSIATTLQRSNFNTTSTFPKYSAYQKRINELSCKESKKTAEILMCEYKFTPEKAFEEIRGLEIDSTMPFNNLNIQILNAISQGFKRKDIFALLGGSIEEIENSDYAKELFISKLNFILYAKDANLFYLLQDMAPFTQLHEEAIHTIVRTKNCSYTDAVFYLKEYDIDDITYIVAQKYREAAGHILGLDVAVEIGSWFNTAEHVEALNVLVNIKKMNIDDAFQELKSKTAKDLELIVSKGSLVENYSRKLK